MMKNLKLSSELFVSSIKSKARLAVKCFQREQNKMDMLSTPQTAMAKTVSGKDRMLPQLGFTICGHASANVKRVTDMLHF